MTERNIPYAVHAEASENYRWHNGRHLLHSVELMSRRRYRGFMCRTFGYVPASSLPWNRPRKRKMAQ